MKKKISILEKNIWRFIAPLALFITTISVNSTCMFEFYQPKMPKGSDKLKNFK